MSSVEQGSSWIIYYLPTLCKGGTQVRVLKEAGVSPRGLRDPRSIDKLTLPAGVVFVHIGTITVIPEGRYCTTALSGAQMTLGCFASFRTAGLCTVTATGRSKMSYTINKVRKLTHKSTENVSIKSTVAPAAFDTCCF